MDNSVLIGLAIVLVLLPAILGWLSLLRWVIQWLLHRNHGRLNVEAYRQMLEAHQDRDKPGSVIRIDTRKKTAP